MVWQNRAAPMIPGLMAQRLGSDGLIFPKRIPTRVVVLERDHSD